MFRAGWVRWEGHTLHAGTGNDLWPSLPWLCMCFILMPRSQSRSQSRSTLICFAFIPRIYPGKREKARRLPVDWYRFSIHMKSINISPTLQNERMSSGRTAEDSVHLLKIQYICFQNQTKPEQNTSRRLGLRLSHYWAVVQLTQRDLQEKWIIITLLPKLKNCYGGSLWEILIYILLPQISLTRTRPCKSLFIGK